MADAGQWATWRQRASCQCAAAVTWTVCPDARRRSETAVADWQRRQPARPLFFLHHHHLAVTPVDHRRLCIFLLPALAGSMSRHERTGVRSVIQQTASAASTPGTGSSLIRKRCIYSGCSHVSSGADEKLVAHAMGSHVSNCHGALTHIYYGGESEPTGF